MKKWFISGSIIFIICVVYLIYFKPYYPPLPVDSVSKREVVHIAKGSDKIEKLTEDKKYEWYISKMDQGKAYTNLKRMLENRGWSFIEQLGSGFIFHKNNEEMIIESEMWTGKYVIFQIPNSSR